MRRTGEREVNGAERRVCWQERLTIDIPMRLLNHFRITKSDDLIKTQGKMFWVIKPW